MSQSSRARHNVVYHLSAINCGDIPGISKQGSWGYTRSGSRNLSLAEDKVEIDDENELMSVYRTSNKKSTYGDQKTMLYGYHLSPNKTNTVLQSRDI